LHFIVEIFDELSQKLFLLLEGGQIFNYASDPAPSFFYGRKFRNFVGVSLDIIIVLNSVAK
jgi:hypothetical protein